VAELRITDGPPMLRSENGRLAGFVYVDIRGRDLKSAVIDMQTAVAEQVKLPAGYSVSGRASSSSWSAPRPSCKVVVPFTLGIIFVLLYLTFRRFDEALLIWPPCPSR
jgi:Cu(I)/Ag(I) efflux system membrane protein CusA/SilA